MQEIDIVFAEYLDTRARLVTVPADNSAPAVAAVRASIPAILQEAITRSGRADVYQVKGSVGEYPLNMSTAPWVAIFRTSVTTSARRGYYIVLLFAHDFSSAVLSLNQGVFEFEQEYGSKCALKMRGTADFASGLVPTPRGFTKGSIDLRSKILQGQGAEQGAIFSKVYRRGEPLDQALFIDDVVGLLKTYDELYSIAGKSILTILPPPSDDEFQEAVQKEAAQGQPEILTVGPQPKPEKIIRQGRSSYSRSTKVANAALSRSGYQCAAASPGDPHPSFISKTSGKNYVEAHHLIPFSRQDEFPYSLDVEDNVVPLCPNCHRLVHLALANDKNRVLKKLFSLREEALQTRGIFVEWAALKGFYRSLSKDEE